MKKILILPLLAGVFSACFAFSPTVILCDFETQITQNSVYHPSLEEIFEIAIPQFQEKHSISVTLSQLQMGYDDGTVTVTEVGSQSYRVNFDGNDVISTLGDYF